jgi:hypothetical protein
MTEHHTQAVNVVADAFLWQEGDKIAALALSSRLPSMFAFAENVES